jgi:hypothetical protein
MLAGAAAAIIGGKAGVKVNAGAHDRISSTTPASLAM